MAVVICMECDGEVLVEDGVMLGEILECPECSFELEVVNLDLLTLAEAPEIEEDWGE